MNTHPLRQPPSLSIDDLATGDLLFFARPSLIQWFGELVADPYRGVGIVELIDGRPVVYYCGRAGVVRAEVADMVAGGRYQAIAVGRLDQRPDGVDAIGWVHRHYGRSIHYPVSVIPPAFFLSAARTWRGRGAAIVLAVVVRVLEYWCGMHQLLVRSDHVFICSTFIADALGHNDDHRPLTPRLSRPKHQVRQGRLSRADRTLARLLLTPSDLWRSLHPNQRWILRAQPVATVLRSSPSVSHGRS